MPKLGGLGAAGLDAEEKLRELEEELENTKAQLTNLRKSQSSMLNENLRLKKLEKEVKKGATGGDV